MDFCSMFFLVCFFPLFLLFYYFVPAKYRNAVIFAGSLIAYGIHYSRWLPALLLFIVWNYYLYRSSMGERKKKALVLVSNLAALVLSKLSEEGMPGVSFLVFTTLAFQLDFIHKKYKKKRVLNLIDFGAYLSFFPKLLSGPITRYEQFRKGCFVGRESARQLIRRLEQGLSFFIIGLFYKIGLADTLAGFWNEVRTIGLENISTPLAWLSMLVYSMQIYFDFHGYSMMAIGLAKMMGMELPYNFLTPYAAVSVSDFFRRWHMTLGQWFRDYVYIPLGGNRKGKLRTSCNLAVVWLLTGLWHGFDWNYLIWAGILLFFILLERAGFCKVLKTFRPLGHLYVWLVIPVSWMAFAIGEPADILIFYRTLIGQFGMAARPDDIRLVALKYVPILIVSFLLTLPAGKRRSNVETWMDHIPWIERLLCEKSGSFFRMLVLFLLFWWAVYRLAVGTVNPFLYFSF